MESARRNKVRGAGGYADIRRGLRPTKEMPGCHSHSHCCIVHKSTNKQTNNKWNSPREPATAQIKENVTLWLGDTTELYSRTEHLLHDTCRTWKSLRLRVSTAVMKLRDRKQLGEGDVYSAYTSIALFINEGRWGRNSNWAGI